MCCCVTVLFKCTFTFSVYLFIRIRLGGERFRGGTGPWRDQKALRRLDTERSNVRSSSKTSLFFPFLPSSPLHPPAGLLWVRGCPLWLSRPSTTSCSPMKKNRRVDLTHRHVFFCHHDMDNLLYPTNPTMQSRRRSSLSECIVHLCTMVAINQ